MIAFSGYCLKLLRSSHVAQHTPKDPGKAIAAGEQQRLERQEPERQRREREAGSHVQSGQQNGR